jgi:GDP-L-fucose synthase
MKTILVTGGSGLVGSAIKEISTKYTEYNFIFVRSKDYDLSSMEETKQMFETIQPTIVIHLAACVGGLFKNMTQKVDMLEKNLMINYNIVKCSHDYKIKKLIACLSTCIFPDKTTYPINETMLHDGPPHFSNDAYAYAKRMLEIHCAAYRETCGDNFVCIIPTNIYGPHDNYNLQDAHVIPALIHKCHIAKQSDEDFVVMGSGTPLRQFIYSEDLARLILWTMENFNESSIILSVGEKEEVTIEHVARLIAQAFDYEHRIQFDTSKPDGQYKKTADNSKLLSYGNFTFVTIEEGIKKSVDWFVENFETARK